MFFSYSQPVLTSEPRRRSSRTEIPQYATLPLQNDSVDELPLPPTPLNNVENPYRYETLQNPGSRESRESRKSRTSTTSISSSSSSAAKRSQSQPPHSLPPNLNGVGSNPNGGISKQPQPHNSPAGSSSQQGVTSSNPAPTIERHKKPSRLPSNGYHTYNSHRSNSQSQYQNNDNSLDRRTHMRDMKMVSLIVLIFRSIVI